MTEGRGDQKEKSRGRGVRAYAKIQPRVTARRAGEVRELPLTPSPHPSHREQLACWRKLSADFGRKAASDICISRPRIRTIRNTARCMCKWDDKPSSCSTWMFLEEGEGCITILSRLVPGYSRSTPRGEMQSARLSFRFLLEPIYN